MRTECIDAVTQAIGRALNASELKNIEDRVRSAMPAARTELLNQGQAVTPRAMMEMAAEIASKGLEADSAKVKQRIANTIAAHDRVQNYLTTAKARGIDNLTALDQLVAFDAKAAGRVLSVETQGKAIADEAIGRLVQTFEATNPKWFGMVEDMAGIRLLVKEMMGENTGHAEAAAGAKAWKETTEALRLRFNAAGGDIGKLEDWGLPHHHSQSKVWKAGADAWVKDIMPMLNRDKYVRADGTLMDDAELEGVLRKAWDTISSNGMSKIEPGKTKGSAMRANWGSESRQIHFKDGDAWTAYQVKYGEQGFYDVMMGHVRGIAHQIALVETFGPNPNRSFELFRDQAVLDAIAARKGNPEQIREQAGKTTRLFNHVAGQVLPVANEGMARGFDDLRSWLVASRLGSAVITSITDEATMALMGHVNNLPEMQILRNELTALNPANKADRRLLARMGLAGEVMASNLGRFGQEGLGASFASKMATATIRASGLSAMTAARKAAFGATMMDSIGHLVKTSDFAKLDAIDNRILLSKGVTETDWAVWKLAKLESWRGNDTMLTPEAVRAIPDADLAKIAAANNTTPARLRNQATTRLLGSVLEEVDMAVITPGAREKLLTHGQQARGTLGGEIWRSIWLFKSFPLAMIERHASRGWAWGGEQGGTAGGRAKYLMPLLLSTTLLGGLAVEINELLAGRDPKNANPWDDPKKAAKFWAQAFFKGGSLGLYGDFIYSEATQHGGGGLAAMLGPVAGLAEEMIGLTQGNLIQAAQGKDTKIGAETVKAVKGLTPGASLWYIKGAADHLFFQQLQNELSPGYLSAMSSRARREFNQEYWWEPGHAAPERAPNLSRITGG
jgi:hypothetical protein